MKQFISIFILSFFILPSSLTFAADPLFWTGTALSASWTSVQSLSNEFEQKKTINDKNEFEILKMDVQEDPADLSSLVVYWILKANKDITIKSADVVLNYDETAFDVTASDITAWGEWTALPLKTPNISVKIVNWKIAFSVQSATVAGFTNKPEGEYLFVVVFKKSANFDSKNKYVFSLDWNESKISDLNWVNLLKPEWVKTYYISSNSSTVKDIVEKYKNINKDKIENTIVEKKQTVLKTYLNDSVKKQIDKIISSKTQEEINLFVEKVNLRIDILLKKATWTNKYILTELKSYLNTKVEVETKDEINFGDLFGEQ